MLKFTRSLTEKDNWQFEFVVSAEWPGRIKLSMMIGLGKQSMDARLLNVINL